MKILTLAPHAYFEGIRGFERNNSGFAYAVADTCEALADMGSEMYLLTQSAITEGTKVRGINIVRKKWGDVILNTKLRDIRLGIHALKGRKLSFANRLKIIFYFMNRGYAEKIIKTIKPDAVHIQSNTEYTFPYMIAASNCGVPYIVSNHGICTFLPNVDPIVKNREGCFFKIAEKNGTVVTCVSTGIKERIASHYNITIDNVIVIPNCYKEPKDTDDNVRALSCSANHENLKAELKLREDSFVFISVGSISFRKNQTQTLRAFHKLLIQHSDYKMVLLFVGDGPQREELEEYAKSNGLHEYVRILGNVPHERINDYYAVSNCTVMASIDEGFGLPVVEGYANGLPSVMFSDLDAVKDISFNETTVLVDDRTDESLANGMWKAIETEWNSDIVKEVAQKFTKSIMGERYYNALRKGVDVHSSIPTNEIVSLVKGRNC